MNKTLPFSSNKSFTIKLLWLVFGVFTLSIVSLCIGVYSVPPLEVAKILLSNIIPIETTWTPTMQIIVLDIRLPRVIASIIVGFSLAIAGSGYQGVFKNPLVSPDILGVSSGATVGAAIAILLGLSYYLNMLFAFLSGLLAVGLCMLIPVLTKKKSTLSLILSGIIVSGFLTSILGMIKYVADPYSQLPNIVFWQMGSLSKVNYTSIAYATPLIVVCSLFLFLMRWRLNVLSFGDKEARSLGANLVMERSLIIIISTLLTAISVCISGTIGWLGLTMPHFARMLVGDDNVKVIPLAGIIGSIFLLLVDLISRNLTGAEIPLGIITGFIGAPLFTVLLIKQRKVD